MLAFGIDGSGRQLDHQTVGTRCHGGAVPVEMTAQQEVDLSRAVKAFETFTIDIVQVGQRMVNEDDAEIGVLGFLESLAKLRLPDEETALVVRSRSPGGVELENGHLDAFDVAVVDPPGPFASPAASRTEEALGEGIERLQPSSEQLHDFGVAQDVLDLVLTLKTGEDVLLGSDGGTGDVVVAGYEKEVLCRLELERLGESLEESFGLLVLLLLAGEGDVAGGEDEVGCPVLVLELTGVA
jgi:hypothetical protein